MLGGLSLGHEYDHRTLPMLLAQPVPRSRLIAPKVIVLAVLLAALALAGSIVSAAVPQTIGWFLVTR